MESSIDMQIHRSGMSAASLERTTDWWESFITQAVSPDPHPLRQCNLTVALTQTNVRICYASFPPMTSHMMSSVWVGDGYLIQTTHRATTPPQTHTQTIPLHTSRPLDPAFILHAPHPITPPCPSCHGTSLALFMSSTSKEQSGGQLHHNDFACCSKTGPSSNVVTHQGYPITRGKFWCEWGRYIFAKRSWTTHRTTKLLKLNVIWYAGVNQA